MSGEVEPNPTVEPSESARVIASNINMLQGPMNQLLLHESVGGNAGSQEWEGERYSSAAANGYLNPLTGEITAFTNSPKQKSGVPETDINFSLKVLADFKYNLLDQSERPKGFFKITEFSPEIKLAQKPQQNVLLAIDAYNRQNE